MGPHRSLRPRGFPVSRSLAAGSAVLMSIMGCAHLGKAPSQTSTTGSAPRAPETAHVPDGSAGRGDAAAAPASTPGASQPADGASAQANSAPGTSTKHDQSSGAAASSKNEANNSSKARSNTGGIAKIPAPVKGVPDKGQPRAAVPPTLGLTDLEQRLRDTHAIGVFTKLSLKNQIDDLLGQLRAYHQKPTVASLPELRHRYDELLQKVIGLLQSGDPSLAKDISSSREAIWSFLTDSTTIS
jgi:hypothetical protein